MAWHDESLRHSKAAQGIPTGRKDRSKPKLNFMKGHIKQKRVFYFKELTSDLKEKAREWARNILAEGFDPSFQEDTLRDNEMAYQFEQEGLTLEEIKSKNFYWGWERGQYFAGEFIVKDKQGHRFWIKSVERGGITVEMLDPPEDWNESRVEREEFDIKNNYRVVTSGVLKWLRNDYEGQFEDSAVDDFIEANDYEFDENGKRAT